MSCSFINLLHCIFKVNIIVFRVLHLLLLAYILLFFSISHQRQLVSAELLEKHGAVGWVTRTPKKKKKKLHLNQEAAIFTCCSIARAYIMSFWIEVRSSAHSQALCLTAVLKGLHWLEMNGLYFIAKHTKQTWDHSALMYSLCWFVAHSTKDCWMYFLSWWLILRNPDVRDRRCTVFKLYLGLQFTYKLGESITFYTKQSLKMVSH